MDFMYPSSSDWLSLASGPTAPYPIPAAASERYAQYAIREANERAEMEWAEPERIKSYEEWKEWKATLQLSTISQQHSLFDHLKSPSLSPQGSRPSPSSPSPLAPVATIVSPVNWFHTLGNFTEETFAISTDQQLQAPLTYAFPTSSLSYELPTLLASGPTAPSLLFEAPPSPLHTHLSIQSHPNLSSTSFASSPSSPKRPRAEPHATTSSSTQSDTSLTPYPSTITTSDSTSPVSLPPQSPKRKAHSRKKSASHIPRPLNSFMLFRQHAHHTGLIPKDAGPTQHKVISKVIGEIWGQLPPEEKKVWDLLAEEKKREHHERYPDYKYQPKPRTTPSVSESNSDSSGPEAKPTRKRVRPVRKPLAGPAAMASTTSFATEDGDIIVQGQLHHASTSTKDDCSHALGFPAVLTPTTFPLPTQPWPAAPLEQPRHARRNCTHPSSSGSEFESAISPIGELGELTGLEFQLEDFAQLGSHHGFAVPQSIRSQLEHGGSGGAGAGGEDVDDEVTRSYDIMDWVHEI